MDNKQETVIRLMSAALNGGMSVSKALKMVAKMTRMTVDEVHALAVR